MQAAIMQVVIQAVMAVAKAMKEAEPPTKPHTRRSSPEEPHKPRQAGPMLSQPAFHFEMKVANVL